MPSAKTMENLRGGEIIRQLLLVADPGYITHRIFNENLISIHSVKSKLSLNRPIYVGMCILNLPNFGMYDFWYNDLKLKRLVYYIQTLTD